ncbi:MAG TPA: methyltransferase [Pseudonocardia sp.]|nr:methyltransferase [Pseudonocardia sp.]
MNTTVETADDDSAAPAPDGLLQLGLAFWGSKTLLSAVELGVFTELADGPLPEAELTTRLGLHARGARDFFDALVALGVLDRGDDGYHNTPEADAFLDRAKPHYIGGVFDIANDRLYGFWGSLTEALRTGSAQNEIKTGGSFFEVIYQDPTQLRLFLQAMTGVSMGAAQRIAVEFPWHRYRTVIDIGCAQGCLPVQLASRHGHLSGAGFDLPPVAPVFDEYVRTAGLSDRLQFHPGDFFTDPVPSADVLVMGHILHDWGLPEKKALIRKAYSALPDGGALIVYDAMIDDQRRANAFGLLMSLNMLIETPGGFDYTGGDCRGWLDEAGFRSSYVKALAGPDSMVVGVK